MRFDKDYSKSEFIEAKMNYRGHKEDDDVCEWLSEIFEQDVYLIRAEKNRLGTVYKDRLPYSRQDDRRQAFLTDGALHIVN